LFTLYLKPCKPIVLYCSSNDRLLIGLYVHYVPCFEPHQLIATICGTQPFSRIVQYVSLSFCTCDNKAKTRLLKKRISISRQSGNEMPLPGVLPGQPSLLNSSRQLGNGMPLPSVLLGACARRAGKQALHIADEVEGLVVHSLGAMSHRCTHCNALRFEHEKKCTTLCCGGGKMSGLSNVFPAPALQALRDLLTSVPSEHQPLPPATKDFRQNIRAYNFAL
jgi:hypothetical protein